METVVYEIAFNTLRREPFQKLLLSAPPEERDRIFRLPQRKQNETLFGSLLLRMLLVRRAGLDGSKIRLSRTERGKPYLSERPDLFFNVTHTEFAAAAALSFCPVGVDAERIRPLSERLISRCFTVKEQFALDSSPALRNRQAIRIWTRKEAYSKMLGTGLSLPFSSVCVLDSGLIVTRERSDYVLSVCTEKPTETIFEQIAPEELERFFSDEILLKKD